MIAMGLRRLQASCYKWSYMLAPKVWLSHLEIVTLFEGLVFALLTLAMSSHWCSHNFHLGYTSHGLWTLHLW